MTNDMVLSNLEKKKLYYPIQVNGLIIGSTINPGRITLNWLRDWSDREPNPDHQFAVGQGGLIRVLILCVKQ